MEKMAIFNDLGYCPYMELHHSKESVWVDDLDDIQRGQRKALWELVGPYMVCDSRDTRYVVKAGKLFFGTELLADQILVLVVERYDFSKKAPIWIKQPLKHNGSVINVTEYIIQLKEKKPELCFTAEDAGILAVICDGEVEGEIIIAFWDISD